MMIGLECPRPGICCFQTIFSEAAPSFQLTGTAAPVETPSSFGPRHCGQSSAETVGAGTSAVAATAPDAGGEISVTGATGGPAGRPQPLMQIDNPKMSATQTRVIRAILLQPTGRARRFVAIVVGR